VQSQDSGKKNVNMDTNLTVFISNLSFEVEENKVRAVFEKVNKLLKENYKV
jgi:RNA recognition motif-containing protein